MKQKFPCVHAALHTAAFLSFGLISTVQAAPPTPGTLLQQTTPPAALPTAPVPILTLPKPEQQGGKASTRIAVRKIILDGNTQITTSNLLPFVKELQNKIITLGELNEAAGRITSYYRSHGYPLAYAYIPAQSVIDGILHIAVVEPRYDKVKILGNSRLKPSQAERTLNLRSGNPVEGPLLQRGLLLLNQTPGVQVAGTLVPGAKPATSSLEVLLTDTPLLRGSVSIDNEGTDSTGRTRRLASLTLDNPFGYGSQISVNGLATVGGLLRAGGFNILSPNLYHGLRAGLYGSRTKYTLGGDFASLNQTGQADQLGLNLSYPLILEPGRLLNVQFDALRNNLKQESSTTSLDDRTHIDLARLTLSGALADKTGITSGGLSLSQGNLMLDSVDAQAADSAGPHAAGRFQVTQIQIKREQFLPHNFKLQVNLSGQLASKNLDGSQKFYLGGPYGVMSYPVGEAGGDDGYLLRLKLAHAVTLGLPGNLEAALIGQYGKAWLNHTSYIGATNTNDVHLAGAGVGLDYHWSRLTTQLEFVHRLGSTAVLNGPDHKQQIWANLRLDF